MIAFAKLQELMTGRPITYPGQKYGNLVLLAVLLALGLAIVAGVEKQAVLVAIILGALAFGVLFVLPIGGADMPVVISMLNAFTGLAASATGFVLHQTVLIVSGMLVGASGTMLTLMMARAMGRSVTNVLFGAFGQLQVLGRGARGGGRRRPADDGRGRRRHARLLPNAWSSSPATGSRSPRRSTRYASSRTSSRSGASTSATRSIRSPAACRAT